MADEFGWIGTAAKSQPVADSAEEAAWEARRAPFFRLHAAVLAQYGLTAPSSILEIAQAEEADTGWREWIAALLETSGPKPKMHAGVSASLVLRS